MDSCTPVCRMISSKNVLMKKWSGKTSANLIRGKEKNPANHGLLTGWRHWSLRKSLQAIYIWENVNHTCFCSPLLWDMATKEDDYDCWIEWNMFYVYYTMPFLFLSITTLFWDHTGWHRVPGGVWRSSTHTHVYTYTCSHYTHTHTHTQSTYIYNRKNTPSV